MTGEEAVAIPVSVRPLILCNQSAAGAALASESALGYTLSHVYICGGKTMRVSKWGNSLAIRLPAAVVEALGLREGDDVTLHAAGKRILEIEKTPGARELLARLRRFRGRLPKDFRFDRLEAHERR